MPELFVAPFDRDQAVALADGQPMVPGTNHVREGCVIRPIRERVDVRLGRPVLKIVGNAYLKRAIAEMAPSHNSTRLRVRSQTHEPTPPVRRATGTALDDRE